MTAKSQRKRGRPRNPPPERAYTAVASNLGQLSVQIAEILGIPKSRLTDQIAKAADKVPVTAKLRRAAPLVRKGSGRRPALEIAALIKDCAMIHSRWDRQVAVKELRKIGGWLEDGRGHPITDYAHAALTALGQPRPQSLRQQVRQAIELLN